MLVHILNRHGKALMPCHPAKARMLLKEGKAKPVKGKTGYFTIQLLYGSSGYKQEIVVGIDTGAKRVPIASVGNGQVYYAKEKRGQTLRSNYPIGQATDAHGAIERHGIVSQDSTIE